MEKEKKKKSKKLPIAILVTILLILVSTFLFFNYVIKPVSPLGTYIEVCVFCDETGEPIPAGLAVTVVGEGFKGTLYTDETGCTGRFGSGLIDGTYTISFYWNDPYSYEVEINCSQIVWHFDYYVPNPTIIKHFVYDLLCDDGTYPPVVGLEVSLLENGIGITSDITDASGTVTFGGKYVDVCKDYTLQYVWGSVPYTTPEPPIHFKYNDYGELEICVWEETNYLEPKSVGDTSA